jgi:DNA-binding GntR family transcriptional regulator
MQALVLPNIETTKLSEKVYRLLKEQIVQRKLVPGEKLDIHALAKMLGISRSPVKEAFNRLGLEGLIEIYPQRGTFVKTPPGPEEVEELFAIRLMIELWGAEAVIRDRIENLDRMAQVLQRCDQLFASSDAFDYMAFFQGDHEFHTIIVDAAKNRRLREMYDSLAVHIQILRTYWGQPRDRALRSHEQHHQIFKAFQKGDLTATKMLRDHIDSSKALTLALGNVEEPRSELIGSALADNRGA